MWALGNPDWFEVRTLSGFQAQVNRCSSDQISSTICFGCQHLYGTHVQVIPPFYNGRPPSTHKKPNVPAVVNAEVFPGDYLIMKAHIMMARAGAAPGKDVPRIEGNAHDKFATNLVIERNRLENIVRWKKCPVVKGDAGFSQPDTLAITPTVQKMFDKHRDVLCKDL